jgi:hypothetical protein
MRTQLISNVKILKDTSYNINKIIINTSPLTNTLATTKGIINSP